MADAKMPEKLGRYEVIRELGKGAMGVVYEGKDPNIGRRVAIKTARREVVEASGMADEMMERFLREAQAAGALNHPNIITIYDAAEQDGIAYIAMEYLEGGDLGDVIDSKKKLSMEAIADIGACICEALDVAHANGVVHRDIKPANILMPTGQPLKVADFGIAHVSDSNLTQDGALIGTPHYMSPEQFMGQKLDGRSDLFSVGNILYELTTGEKPFGGEALSTVMHHVIKTDPVPPTELNFNVPDALAQVIMKALSKRPANRYKTGREMANALRESIKEHPNAAIIDPSNAITLESTVAGVTATAVQATQIGGAPNEDLVSTLASARPGSQESTIAEGPGATRPGGAPSPDATVPGGAPAPGATVAGPPPAAGTIPGGHPAGLDHGKAQGGNKNLLIGGGVAAALLVVIAGFMLSGGGDEPGAVANYYVDLSVEIYRTRTDVDYKAYKTGEKTIDDLDGQYDEVGGLVHIEILDANGNRIAEAKEWTAGDMIFFDPSLKANNLRYLAHIPTPTPEAPGEVTTFRGELAPADKPEATGDLDIILPPQGV